MKGFAKLLLGEDSASIVACSYMKARAGADDEGLIISRNCWCETSEE